MDQIVFHYDKKTRPVPVVTLSNFVPSLRFFNTDFMYTLKYPAVQDVFHKLVLLNKLSSMSFMDYPFFMYHPVHKHTPRDPRVLLEVGFSVLVEFRVFIP